MKASAKLRVDKSTTFEVVVNELVKLIPNFGNKTLPEIDLVHRFVDPITGEANVIRLNAREYDQADYAALSRSKRESKAENDLQFLEREAKAEGNANIKKGYVKI